MMRVFQSLCFSYIYFGQFRLSVTSNHLIIQALRVWVKPPTVYVFQVKIKAKMPGIPVAVTAVHQGEITHSDLVRFKL